MTPIDIYNIAVSLLAGVGLLYLLYSGRYAVWYRRFYLLITFGLFLSVLGGPLLLFVSAASRHAVHGLATLFVAAGLYDLVRTEITRTDDWKSVLTE